VVRRPADPRQAWRAAGDQTDAALRGDTTMRELAKLLPDTAIAGAYRKYQEKYQPFTTKREGRLPTMDVAHFVEDETAKAIKDATLSVGVGNHEKTRD
jgi:hypothetical protein